MTLLCTLKPNPWDVQPIRWNYEIVNQLAYAVTLRKAFPTASDSPVCFTVGRDQIEYTWEDMPVDPLLIAPDENGDIVDPATGEVYYRADHVEVDELAGREQDARCDRMMYAELRRGQ